MNTITMTAGIPNAYPIAPLPENPGYINLKGFFCDPNRVDDSDATVATLYFMAHDISSLTRVRFRGGTEPDTTFLSTDWTAIWTSTGEGVAFFVDNQPPEFVCLDPEANMPGAPGFEECLDCRCLPDPNISCIEDIPACAASIEEFLAQEGLYAENVPSYFCGVEIECLGQEVLADGSGCASAPYVLRRFYRITDEAGYYSCGYQIITVIDDTPPEGSPPDPIQVEMPRRVAVLLRDQLRRADGGRR